MAVSIESRPPDPVLSRTRQQWRVISTSHTSLDRYRVQFQVFQSGGKPPFVLTQAPVGISADTTTFEVSDVVDALLYNDLPTHGGTAPAVDQGGARQVAARLREVWYNANGDEQIVNTDFNFWAVGAGLGHSHQGADLHSSMFNGGQFMAYTGSGLETPADAQGWLSWFSTVERENLVLRVYRTYEDGSIDHYEAFAIPWTDTDRLFSIPTGYTQLDVGGNGATGNVAQWELEVYSNALNQAVSGRFAFRLATRSARRSFLFVNSAGAWQVLHCFGHVEEALEFERSVAERNLPIGHSPQEEQLRHYRPRDRKTMRASTGYLPKGGAAILHALELLRSRRVYEMRDNGFVPILITNSEQQTDFSLPGLLAVQLQYREAFFNRVHNGPMP